MDEVYMQQLKSLFLISIICFSLPMWAIDSQIVIKAPQTPSAEFQTYIQTEQAVPYSKILLRGIKNQKQDVDHLVFLLGQAQKFFLKDHLKTAGEHFQSIVQMAHKTDWVLEARKIIFYSFLRLAQIEWKGENPEVFLHSAVLFSSDLDPDSSLFPPPLVEKFHSLKKNLPGVSLYLNRIFPFHETVLINGKEFSVRDQPRLPYGEYRVTALSSSHKTWSQVISLSNLSQTRVVTPSWISGDCNNPVVPKSFMEYHILFPDFCWWSKPLSVFTKKPKKLNIENMKEIDQLEKSHFLSNNTKWILLGLGSIFVGYFLMSSKDNKKQEKKEHQDAQSKNNTKEKNQPTVKIGF